MQENKELSRIEALYQEDFTHTNIEKKYNKLIKLKIEPYINCIVYQYFLNEIGGDHYTKGILSQSNKYLEKINKNITIIQNFKGSEKTLDMLNKRKEFSLKMNKKIKKTYEDYINKCQKDEDSIKFDIYNFHQKQIITYQIVNNKINNNNHQDVLKEERKRVEKLLETEKDDIYCKLLESHIGVIEQQLELLR